MFVIYKKHLHTKAKGVEGPSELQAEIQITLIKRMGNLGGRRKLVPLTAS